MLVAFAIGGTPARADDLAGAATDDDALSRKATDPTASLMSFQLNDWYTPSLRGIDGSTNQIAFRSAIPFDFLGRANIFRVTLPYYTQAPGTKGGISDTTVFDIAVFDAPWGRWGAGASGTLPTGASGLTQDKWTVGPAAGFVNNAAKGINWGLFTQTFFSYAGSSQASAVGLVNVQPIFSYQLGHGRSLSLGNSALVYDVHHGWSSLMLGVNYGQVVSFAGHKWRPNYEVDYDFKQNTGNAEWVFRAGVALLIPTR